LGDATDDQDALLSLLRHAKAVLFDFDGPICALFAGRPTKNVADRIKKAARGHWEREFLAPEVENCDDSHDVLRHLRGMYDADPNGLSPVPLKDAEDIVAKVEEEAVETALPAAGVVTLVELLSGLGKRLAVVSNNAEDPIGKYLRRPDVRLGSKFDGVFGRDPDDALLMKPNPYCVERAIEKLSLTASDCLLVGDKLSDLEAARSAGTSFLGYTRKPVRAAKMRENGAEVVVASHTPVIAAARKLRGDLSASQQTCRERRENPTLN
jgi:HAD superfamily hydrolase (TIGR01509 family)